MRLTHSNGIFSSYAHAFADSISRLMNSPQPKVCLRDSNEKIEPLFQADHRHKKNSVVLLHGGPLLIGQQLADVSIKKRHTINHIQELLELRPFLIYSSLCQVFQI